MSACAVGPDFVRPEPPGIERYTHEPQIQATLAADGHAQRFDTGGRIAADWWHLFGSEPLNAAVSQALAHNPTLQASLEALRQSQDNLRAGYGVFFPQIQAGESAARQRSATSQLGGLTAGTRTASAGGAQRGTGTIFNVVTLSATVSYTLDVFGGERRNVESLRAQTDSQRYQAQAACLTLTSNVVNTCIARAGYAAQIRATQELIGLESQQLHLAEAQYQSGFGAYANVLTLRSQIAANEASLAPLKVKIAQAEDLLASLEGMAPPQATLPDIDITRLTLPVDLPVSLPSDLVNQRPDILSSEALMHVASAKIGVATAAMFPSFNLTGSYGATGPHFGSLSAANAKFWSIGQAVNIPVFQGFSLWYGRRAAIDAYRLSQANYRVTVLNSFGQVADILKALEHDAEGLQAQSEAQSTAADALRLLQANYNAGLVAFIDVLTADVQLHQATIAYVQAVTQRYQDTVALYAALGGGWWNGVPDTAKGATP